jgi:hypothetical protein
MVNAGVVALVPGVASATVRGQIDICDDSGRGVVVELPQRNGFPSYIVNPRRTNGPCVPFKTGGGNAWEEAVVHFVSPDRYLSSFGYNPSRGAAIFVNGDGNVRVYN